MAKGHKLSSHSRARASHAVVKPVAKTVSAPSKVAPKSGTGHGRGKKTFVQYG